MPPFKSLQTLIRDLIACPSVTPNDAGCQTIIAQYLTPLGFQCQSLPFGRVSNLWARKGTQSPLFLFLGHTDVVPTGDLSQWEPPPFQATVRNDRMYGRGIADMKGSIAAMLDALRMFITQHPNHQGSIALLITSDEEGPAIDGTQRVIQFLKANPLPPQPTWVLVGEPSCTDQLGDTIKIGRRGSLNATLTITGQAGHIAYPALADNPISQGAPIIQLLEQIVWDQGTQDFPPSCLQFSNVQAGYGVSNVIPQQMRLQFNIRYVPTHTVNQLKQKIHALLDAQSIDYTIDWHHSANPFLSKPGKLRESCVQAIQQHTPYTPVFSTSGGTSDGRFLADLDCEIIELGLCNTTIHQINENIKQSDLQKLSSIYQTILFNLFEQAILSRSVRNA